MCRKHVAGKSSSSFRPAHAVCACTAAQTPVRAGRFLFCHAARRFVGRFLLRSRGDVPETCRGEIVEFNSAPLARCARAWPRERPVRAGRFCFAMARAFCWKIFAAPARRCARMAAQNACRSTDEAFFYCVMARGASLGNSRPARAAMCRKHVAGKSSSSIPSRPCGVRLHGRANAPSGGTGVFYCAMARGALLGNSRPARAAMCRKHVAGKSSSSIPSRPCGVRPYGCANAPSGWRGTFRWRVFVAPARRCLPR